MVPINCDMENVSLLFVEDDAFTRESIRTFIAGKYPAMSIITAEDGEVGLELYSKHRPDIVLTDIRMPVMDGIQMARGIRVLNPAANIIAVTVVNDTECLVEAIKIGISRYVLKPFDNRMLIEAMDDCLGRIAMERRIAEQNDFIRKLSRVVEQGPSMVMIANAVGVVEYVNPKFSRVTGYASSEAVGRHLCELLTDSSPAGTFEKIWRAISGGSAWRGELMNRKKDGDLYCEEISISTLSNEAGEITNFVAVAEDITALQQARQDMLKTQKLESIGIFAGGIAHDFNNILTGIIGNISIATFQLHDPGKVAKRLEDAEKAAFRAKDLTQQLLTFAKGGEPVKQVIELAGLLEEAAGFALHGSNVNCKFDISEDLWPVEVDEGQLVQVTHNLILNAVQAMPEGGTVTVTAKNARTPDRVERFVTISVADTGVGIPDHHLQKIFDPYFTTKQQGSGLGLATCHSIIRKHGGKIRATSSLGKGSSFNISLPAATGECKVKPSTSPVAARGCGSVLVMDDEEGIREVVKIILEEFLYTVECAQDGAEAVQIYRQRMQEGTPFSAVILDLTIPGGMGGKETLKMLLDIDPDVKAIVSSGYSNDPIMANFRDHGFSAILTKPYRTQEINDALQQLLARAPFCKLNLSGG